MTRSRLLLALLALVFIAAACGGSDSGTTAAGPESGSAAAASESGGSISDGIVLPTSDGGQLDFGDLDGKPALLWFWAPW